MSNIWNRLKGGLSSRTEHSKPPWGLRWRSNTIFIVVTIGTGLLTDLFLYGLIVPVVPFILEDRIGTPPDKIQSVTSGLLAAYAGASVVFAPVAGYIADRTTSRQAPFLYGLFALFLATLLLYLGQSVGILILARIFQGLSGAFVWTIGLALCLDTVGPGNLGKTIGTIFSFLSVSGLLGPVLGGILYKHAGEEGVFGASAALLIVDFLMRLLVIEKRVAAKYEKKVSPSLQEDGTENGDEPDDNQQHNGNEESEETPLLGQERDDFKIEVSKTGITSKMPIFYCFKNYSLCASLLVAFVQAIMLGLFDATTPTEARDLFGFDSLQAGVLFIPMSIADLAIGPLAGWAVDKFGPKPVGVISFAWLAPVLIALRAVSHGGKDQLILYCLLLALSGVGLAGIGAPSIVEAGTVVEKYHKANPGLFGENGPYAQLYGFNCMLFSAGLTVGPLLSGSLREAIGYGNMGAVMGVLSFVTSALCFFYLGGPPAIKAFKRLPNLIRGN